MLSNASMSGIANRLREVLEASGVDYEIIPHRRDYRAQRTASDTHTPPEEFAKTVFIAVDERFALAVLPATHTLSPAKLAKSLEADVVRLASEGEMKDLCPDAEVGAEPPFGNLYELPVYVCPVLAQDERITFNAGSHTDAIRMTYAEYARLVQPQVVPMSRHEEDSSPR